MIALEAKRGVEATLERVYKATSNSFEKLVVSWSGSTAGIKNEGDTTYIMFPGIDETKPVSQSMFNEFIGYALHELGHKWFTEDEPWDIAREQHGDYVGKLINGLEDPRIEQKVIDSGYAPNARSLFEFLTNQILRKDGYVKPDDFKNIPFMLAIEGRRLNGYEVCVPSIIDASPYKVELRWALKAAKQAKNTHRIAQIAIELYARLKQTRQQQQQPGESGEQPGGSDQQPGQQPGQPGDQPGEQSGEQPGDASQTDQNGAGDAQTPGEGVDKGSEENGSGNGSGHSEPTGRDVEPVALIQDRCEGIRSKADEVRARPHPGKPIWARIDFI